MAIERKTLRKAPAVDLIDAFTQPPAEPSTANQDQPDPSASPPVAEPAAPSVSSQDAPQAKRRGPGRPPSRMRMEPFSSKIEIGLRDEVDAYLDEHGGTIIAFLDEALRDRLKK